MKNFPLFNIFVVFLGIFMFLFLFPINVQAKELTQAEIDKYIQLPGADRESMLRSLPKALTEQWMDSVISVSSPEEEAIALITRQAIRGKVMDYFLREAPKELGKEAIKIGFQLWKLATTPDITTLFKTFEKMTVQESLKYLGQWLKENETKIAFGNIDFSYDTLLKKKEKHRFQYIIIYSPDTRESVIKIYSANPMSPPASQGSYGGAMGTGWNYSKEQAKGKKIPAFILSIKGKMSREQAGFWKSEITHSYSWDYQPRIDIEFPDFVPSFDFHKKGFFERVGDSVKGFFSKFGNGISGLFGASLVQPSFDDFPEPLSGSQPDNAEWLGEFINKILEQIKLFRQFLSDFEYKKLEQEAQSVRTEEDFNALLKKLEDAQSQIDEMQGLVEKDSQDESQQEQEQEQETGDLDSVENGFPKIIINEVCVGLDSSKNEFVELYNPSDTAVLLNNDNFQLELVSSSNNSAKKKLDWLNNTIPARGYFLLTGGELVINSEKFDSDANFSSQLSSVSGVIISDKNGNILDKVSWGSTTKSPPALAIETSGKILDNGLGTGQSIERSENIDTGNNSEDFGLNESPSPTNSKGEKRIYTKPSEEGNGGDNNSGGGSTGGSSTSGSTGNTGDAGADTVGATFCSQENLGSPAYSPVIFNEIAWMGNQESSANEWIELKNISTSTVQLSGWQILDKDEQIKVIFNNNDAILAGDFYLLERTDDDSVPNIAADKVYSGSLGNTDESLHLFNKNCELIDHVVADPDWSAGDNDGKQTMERSDDLTWHTNNGTSTNGTAGTPKAENSEGELLELNNNQEEEEEKEEKTGGEEEEKEEKGDQIRATSTIGLLVNEVRAVGNEEFVEIYNPLAEEISLNGLYLSYFSEFRDWNEPYINKEFPTSTIASQEYYLIGFGDYIGEPIPDWSPDTRHLSDNSGSVGLFSCNPKIATTSTVSLAQAINQAKACKIDALGWGESIVREGQNAITAQEGKSLARRMEPDNSGYLKYVDTNNNSADFEEQEPTPRIKNYSPYSDLDNDGIIDSYDPATIVSEDSQLEAGEYVFKDLFITNQANLLLKGDSQLDEFKGVKILADNLTIEANCSVNSNSQGYSDSIILEENYTFPQTLGSAGAGIPKIIGQCSTRRGGTGGGAIILEIDSTTDIQGQISANGEKGLSSCSHGCYPTTGGNGGSVYITTNILKGNGEIIADGGNGDRNSLLGKGGQIAVYYQDEKDFDGVVHAFGGEHIGSYSNPGTIYFENSFEKKLSINAQSKEVIFKLSQNLTNLGIIEISNITINTTATTNFESQHFIMQSALLNGPDQKFLNFQVQNFSLIDSEIKANINASAQTLELDTTSLISANGKGFPSDTGPGTGDQRMGGSYGGVGMRNATTTIYGSLTEPKDLGSGGGGNPEEKGFCGFRPGGSGGGVVILDIKNKLNVNGIISANGGGGLPSPEENCSAPSPGCGATAGGSGGSVHITVSTLEGSGHIRTNGGGSCYRVGAGGGGRIAIYGNRDGFLGKIESLGGIGGSFGGIYAGEDGTIYLSP